MSLEATSLLKQSWVSAPVNNDIWQTIELSHSRFTKTWYFTDAAEGFTGTLEDGVTQIAFEAMPFLLRLPSSTSEGLPEIAVTLSNAGQEMVEELAKANAAPRERIGCVVRVYLSNDLTTVQNIPLRLGISQINMNDEAITGIATRSDVLNMRFPYTVYTPELFPGLMR